MVAGGTVTAPVTNPTQSGYVFLFWRLNGTSTAYNFNTPVNSNITLQAKCDGGGVYLGNNPGAEKKAEFVMSGGTIYGTNDILEANNAQYEGKALYRKDGTAKYGNGVAIQSTAVNTTLKGVK